MMHKSLNIPGTGLALGICTAFPTLIGGVYINPQSLSGTLNVLVGGVLTGACVGAIGLCLPAITEDSSHAFIVVRRAILATLTLAAILVSPVIGEQITTRNAEWEQVITDELAGAAFIIGTLLLLSCCVNGSKSFKSNRCCFFSCRKDPSPEEQAAANNQLPI